MVYVVTDLKDYFEKLGFVEMKEGAKKLFDKLDVACRIMGMPNTILMFYEKK